MLETEEKTERETFDNNARAENELAELEKWFNSAVESPSTDIPALTLYYSREVKRLENQLQ